MPEHLIHVDIAQQCLTLLGSDHIDGPIIAQYPVSTGRNGPGEQRGSGCTPRGWHRIRIKIGMDCPANTVFVGRRTTGEIYSPALAAQHPDRDWILSRILWLTGLASGHNRGGTCDTLRRFIYLHGCPDAAPMGIPLSHGCVRMRNADIITLCEQVACGDRVLITA